MEKNSISVVRVFSLEQSFFGESSKACAIAALQRIWYTNPSGSGDGKICLLAISQSRVRPTDYIQSKLYLPKGKTLILLFTSPRRSESRVRATAWLGEDMRDETPEVRKCHTTQEVRVAKGWSAQGVSLHCPLSAWVPSWSELHRNAGEFLFQLARLPLICHHPWVPPQRIMLF